MSEQRTPAAGEIAPGFSLAATEGAVRRLDELAAAGFCVVVFYRGHW
jgi:peroxiredoxin